MRNTDWFVLIVVLLLPAAVRAGDELAPVPSGLKSSSTTSTSSISAAAPANSRFGLFDWLDKRSSYGQGVYPEPFLVDDTDLETNEARLDWLYSSGQGNEHSNLMTGEVEKGFGQVTLEVEAPLELDRADSHTSANFGNIDVGARVPFYEYVDPKQNWDTVFGTALEIGIPTGSQIATNTEVVPKLFNDLRIGDHFTLQSIFGYSTFIGENENEGSTGQQTFEYGFVFAYTITHDQVAIPGLMQLIPMFELSGEKLLNNGLSNGLTADAGVRANLKQIGSIQPRLGAAYVFPLDGTARDDMHWGVVTSLVFEY